MRKIFVAIGLFWVVLASVVAQQLPQVDEEGVYIAGKGLTQAKLVHAAEAVYPSDSSLARIKHVCALRVLIRADGIPDTLRFLNQKASPFDDAAFAAVKQSKFEPGSFDGSSVPTYITLWVPFNVGKGVARVVGTPSQMGASAPFTVNTVPLEFPKQARKEKVDGGMVLVRVLVTDEGLPANAKVVGPAGHGFDESALKAIETYRFKPATLHGVPVPMEIVVEMNFKVN